MIRIKNILMHSAAVLLLATTIHLDNNVRAQNIYGTPTDLVQMEPPQVMLSTTGKFMIYPESFMLRQIGDKTVCISGGKFLGNRKHTKLWWIR
jgi:hypothetical protein